MTDMETRDEDRRRADAEGIIRAIHARCEGSCPHREHCPGMVCRLYAREQAARDIIASLDAPTWDPETYGGVILEPTIR